MSRVFDNCPEDRGRIQCRVIPKKQKMVLDAIMLNTQYYKVRIKGNVEQSKEWSSGLPYTSVYYLLKRGAFRSPSTKVANFTILYLFIYIRFKLLNSTTNKIFFEQEESVLKVSNNENSFLSHLICVASSCFLLAIIIFESWLLPCYIAVIKEETTTIYVSLFLLKGDWIFCNVGETYGGGRRLKDSDTAVLTYDFFSWPCIAVLSSGPCIFASPTSRLGATASRWPSVCLAASLHDKP